MALAPSSPRRELPGGSRAQRAARQNLSAKSLRPGIMSRCPLMPFTMQATWTTTMMIHTGNAKTQLKQAVTVLFGADIVISIILSILSTVTACFSCVFAVPVWIGILAVHIVCMVKGINGERFLIPGRSAFADKF